MYVYSSCMVLVVNLICIPLAVVSFPDLWYIFDAECTPESCCISTTYGHRIQDHILRNNYINHHGSQKCINNSSVIGKLGHGDMNRQTKPVAIQGLCGMYIRKVACSSQTSLALTSTGQVCCATAG